MYTSMQAKAISSALTALAIRSLPAMALTWSMVTNMKFGYLADISVSIISRTLLVWSTIEISRRSDVPVTDPRVTVKIADPKGALKAFSGESLDDTACFAKTMERIEVDLGGMVERANAWAQGDIETLRAKQGPSQWRACSEAMTGNVAARRLGFADIETRVQAAWMAAAEKALDKNASTFAMLPTSQLFNDNGYLAKLAAKGYAIEQP